MINSVIYYTTRSIKAYHFYDHIPKQMDKYTMFNKY